MVVLRLYLFFIPPLYARAMNIQEYLLKIKQKAIILVRFLDKRDTYALSIVISASVASFYLGKLSMIEAEKKPIKIEREEAVEALEREPERITYPEPLPLPNSKASSTLNTYVGSRSGSKYHLPGCPGAKMISEANKIWFGSKTEAEKAGYSPAGNCKGI
jgi:hypothetical protein